MNTRRSTRDPGTGSPAESRRRWWRRLGALCIAPVLLVGAEGLLRATGFGTPASFFIPAQVNERETLIENAQVARRYFPPGLARSPQPVVMNRRKPADVCRIFVLGGSAAMGDPEPAYGLARMLQVLLEGRHPQRRFEVVNAAMTAINSHVVRDIARDCAKRQGDFWILYLGNNEMVGPFGAGTIFGDQTPGLGFIRTGLALRGTRLSQGIERLANALRDPRATPDWGGMEMFLEQEVAADDPGLQTSYGHFRSNLESLVRRGTRAGARVIVGGVVVNLADCPPFASRHRPGLAEGDVEMWDQHLRSGIAAEEAGDPDAARIHFEAALLIDDRHAELQYRLGRVNLALGRTRLGRECLEQARDLDSLRFRADRTLQQIIRQVATEWKGKGVLYVDLPRAGTSVHPHGVAGNGWFYEHVHLNPTGNYYVARALAEAVETELPPIPGRTDGAPSAWPTQDQCFADLALTTWDRLRIGTELAGRIARPPFVNQAGHQAHLQQWQNRLRTLEKALDEAEIERADTVYRQAVTKRPEDWVLREGYARFLLAQGRAAEAEPHWRRVTTLMPHYPDGYFERGNALSALGRPAEAMICFRGLLELRPNSVEVRNAMGLALEDLGRLEEAGREFQRAINLRPDFAGARVNLGQLLIRLDRPDEALAQYQAAILADTNSVAALVNLGNLLGRMGRGEDAVTQYRKALHIEPGHGVAHYNLGMAMLDQNEQAALDHFAQTVRAQPDFVPARFQLGMGLARAGRMTDARKEFEAVVRLNPDMAEARLRLGSLLASAGRHQEAAAQYKECLRLAPGHPTATRFLQQIQRPLPGSRTDR